MELKQVTHIDNVRLSDDGRAVRILDQSLLPNETIYLELQTPEALYEAIATLRVRGPRPSASLPATPSMSWPSRPRQQATPTFWPSARRTGTISTAPAPPP